MKKLVLALFAISSSVAIAQQSTNLSINLEYKQKLQNESKRPMSPFIDERSHWIRGVDTNGVTISVCSGRFNGMPIFRDLTFDKDGKLVSVSPINRLETSRIIPKELPVPTTLRAAAEAEMKIPNKK